jgi:hypothetical protein
MKKLVLPCGQALADALGEVAPELALDVLDGVDAEAVGVGELDPAGVGVDHRDLDVVAGGVDVLEAAGEVAGEQLLGVVVVKSCGPCGCRSPPWRRSRGPG